MRLYWASKQLEDGVVMREDEGPVPAIKTQRVQRDFSDPTIKKGFNAVAFLRAHILAPTTAGRRCHQDAEFILNVVSIIPTCPFTSAPAWTVISLGTGSRRRRCPFYGGSRGVRRFMGAPLVT